MQIIMIGGSEDGLAVDIEEIEPKTIIIRMHRVQENPVRIFRHELYEVNENMNQAIYLPDKTVYVEAEK